MQKPRPRRSGDGNQQQDWEADVVSRGEPPTTRNAAFVFFVTGSSTTAGELLDAGLGQLEAKVRAWFRENRLRQPDVRAALRRYVSGQTMWPRAEMQTALCEVLGAPDPQALGFVPPSARPHDRDIPQSEQSTVPTAGDECRSQSGAPPAPVCARCRDVRVKGRLRACAACLEAPDLLESLLPPGFWDMPDVVAMLRAHRMDNVIA